MTEHERADQTGSADEPRRRGSFQPSAEPVAPTSVDEAAHLLMPVYAEPVARTGPTVTVGAPTLDGEARPVRSARPRRAVLVTALGVVAASIALVAAALIPSAHDGSEPGSGSSALADTIPETFLSSRPGGVVAEGGRTGGEPPARDEEAPEASPRPSREPVAEGGAERTAPRATATPEAAEPDGTRRLGLSASEGQAGTGPQDGSATPAPSAPAETGTEGSDASPEADDATGRPAPQPDGSPDPSGDAATGPSASVTPVDDDRLGLIAPEYRVDLRGEPGAVVRVSTEPLGLVARDVTLDGEGRGSVTFHGLIGQNVPVVSAVYVS